MSFDPPEQPIPKFGPDGAPNVRTVRAFERRYVLAVALGRHAEAAGDGRFLAIWRRLVSYDLQERIEFGQFTVDWRKIVPTDEEKEAAQLWAMLGSKWPLEPRGE